MQRSKFTVFSSLVIAGLAALVLTGCGSSNQNTDSSTPKADTQSDAQSNEAATGDETSSNSSDSDGEAIFSYGDKTYTAQLQFCMLVEGEDALFHGLAVDESGTEVGYLDGDFGGLGDLPHGEVRIDFGATAKFQSTDEFAAMGSVASHIVVTGSTDTDLMIIGGAWDQNGAELPTATLRVTC